MKLFEDFDIGNEEEFIAENQVNDFDLKGLAEYKHNKMIGETTFRSFIMTEKADEAYNQQMTNKICSKIRDIMGDIYIANPSGTRTANKIKLIRKGNGGAYQFEIKINNDGTFTVADNSQARGFMKTNKNGEKKFILLNSHEFYTTNKTNNSGVDELLNWLVDNYDKYEPCNSAARDHAAGINRAAMSTSDSLARRRGQPARTTDMSRRHGISDIAAFLRNGGNIKDLI